MIRWRMLSYQLSAISYQLSAISYQLSAISYQCWGLYRNTSSLPPPHNAFVLCGLAVHSSPALCAPKQPLDGLTQGVGAYRLVE